MYEEAKNATQQEHEDLQENIVHLRQEFVQQKLRGVKHKLPKKAGEISRTQILLPQDYKLVWRKRDQIFKDHLAKQKIKHMKQLRAFNKNQEEIFEKGSSTVV